jgi:hypothetical protein
MKKIIPLLICLVFTISAQAQKWVEMMNDPKANFYDTKKEFDNYWKDRPYERGKGFKVFKRWCWFVEPRVYPSGNMEFASRAKAYEEFQKYLETNPLAKTIGTSAVTATTANWTPLGPFGSPSGGGDAGRLQCIRFLPGNNSVIFVGTAAGGLWVSTNSGASWTTNTDQLATLGVADIAIVPTNTNVMYLATGDNDAGDTKSVGVLKSTDGGVTWNTTGLNWATSLQRRVGRVLINPLNVNEVTAATSNGVYRTLNGGTTWTSVLNGNYSDAEYKPGDTTTIYVGGGSSFYKSTNGGASYSSVNYGALATINRINIGVTPADPNYVYILASKNDNSYGGLYRSVNSASTWSTMSTAPNLFGWSTNGSDAGGQGWYDIAIGVSPTNKDEVTIGGVNTWKSTNGGSTWTLNTHWYGGGGKPYVHADCHDIVYTSGSTCYAGTDGGIAVTTNSSTTWTTVNGTMNISQQYKIGLSASSPSYLVTGHQDNGTNLMNGTNWSYIYGGDGADCFVDWSLNSTIIASYVQGDFQKSTNSGTSWTAIQTGLPGAGAGAWVAPICQNPSNANIFYCGYQEVFKSINKGGSWGQISNIGGGDVLEIRVVPSNTNVIYITKSAAVYKTTNGGTNWSNITGSIPVGSNAITGITVDNMNSNNVYVTLSGYTSGNKVFYSNNGGATWSNYSTGLPNIPANCIVYKNNSPGSVYVGTDVGVYYRELSMSSWIPYFTGLPNVVVDELEIYYPTGKIRAATYGRGTWESDLYSNPSAPPFAFYTTAYTSACINVPFTFTDNSSNSPNSWSWTFPGGSPASSTVANPVVTYTATGIYTISLVSTNTVGASSPYTGTISVVGTPTAAATSTNICVGQTGYLTVNTNASQINWQAGQTGTVAAFSPTTTTVYSYTASVGACQAVGTATLTVGTPPPVPTISQAGNVLTSTSAPMYQWYLNGGLLSGATAQSYTATASGWYSVWVDNGTGCQSSSSAVYITVTDVNELSVFNALEISPNPAKENLNLQFRSKEEKEISFSIKNSLGQVVKSGKFNVQSGEKKILSLDGLSDAVYTLNLATSAASVNYKFVKQ